MDEKFWDELYLSKEQLFSGNPNSVLVTEVTGLEPGRALDVGCGEGGDAIWLAGQGWQVTATDVSQVALDRAARALEASPGKHPVTWLRQDMIVTPPPAGAFDLVTAHYSVLAMEGDVILHNLISAVAPGGLLLVVAHDIQPQDPDAPTHDGPTHDGLQHGQGQHRSGHHAFAHHEPTQEGSTHDGRQQGQGQHGHSGHGQVQHEHGGHGHHGHGHGHGHGAEGEDGRFEGLRFYEPAEIEALLDGGDWEILISRVQPRTTPAPEGTHHVNDTVLKARRRPY
jgi:SAM-dependent methyltransferase